MIKNKSILFIGPIFHDYHQLISKELKALGANVTFYPERKYGLGFKLINNFFGKKQLSSYQEKYYKGVLNDIDPLDFDYLFVVRGFMISKEFLISFKAINPNAVTIMYQWDSNKTNPFVHNLTYFDKAYSFDFKDCNELNSLSYLPLFYTQDVIDNLPTNKESTHDFFFMGWYFEERYQAVLRFKEFAEKHNYSVKNFLYIPITSYIKERLKGKKLDKSIISLKPMDRKKYLQTLRNSKAMIDVSSPNQTGLSMRIIEALASNTRIITNNYEIKNDSKIYNEELVAFFDEKFPHVDPLFLKETVKKQSNLLSLREWLSLIFN